MRFPETYRSFDNTPSLHFATMSAFVLDADAPYAKFVKRSDRQCNAYGLNYEVRTYTVKPLNGRYGTDDDTYKKYPVLYAMIPRGFSELFIGGEHVLTLKGNSKFDGTGIVDDDDVLDAVDVNPREVVNDGVANDAVVNPPIPDDPIAKIDQWNADGQLLVSFSEKANGKMLVFQLFKYNDKLYVFGGSKNVHRIYPFDSRIEGRELHDEIMDVVFRHLHALPAEQLDLIMNQTIVGEYVDGKHLIYVDTPYAVFFNAPAGVILPLTSHILPSINRKPAGDELIRIRKMANIEGVVIEYRNTATGEILRQKHKTEWYVIWRSWRESLSHKEKAKCPPQVAKNLLIKKLRDRSSKYLHLSADELAVWERTADTFIDWLVPSKYDYNQLGPFSAIGMAKVLHDFVHRNECVVSSDVGSPAADVASSSQAAVPADVGSPAAVPIVDFDPLDCLENPALYKHIISIANYGFPMTVVMSGVPGSGKSTVAKMLNADLTGIAVQTGIYSTDPFFCNADGVYVFDPTKLEENHKKNCDAFTASTAAVRIVDNTNILPWEYEAYRKAAKSTILIVLRTKTIDLKALAARNTHGVPLKKLEQMAKKMKPIAPAYYGLFPRPTMIEMFSNHYKLNFSQETPPHVTCLFVGGDVASDKPPHPELLGDYFDINVVGYSVNPAGSCLLVDASNLPDNAGSLPGNHITLSTNLTFKPVDVGRQVTAENSVIFDNPHPLAVVYTPYF